MFKKGDRNEATNYRPISLLPAASKILERIVYEQIQNYLRSHTNLLPAEQFAYRKSHSCEDALSVCINDWQKTLDKGSTVALALLDLSKAFDCVDHTALLHELYQCGIGGTALCWFDSYLSGRHQSVRCPQSPPGNEYDCHRGVPQGSVLGPLLFTLYTRRLPACISHCRCLLYADDTSLYASGGNPDSAIANLEADIAAVGTFLAQKQLKLNANKTQFLVLRKTGTSLPARPLIVNGTTVNACENAKYLGLIVDQHLTFKAQVDSIRAKVGSKLGAMFRCRRLLTDHAKRIFYLSFIQSTIEYASNSYVHALHSSEYDSLVRTSK